MKAKLTYLLLCFATILQAQQTIKGTVIDATTQQAIIGATIVVENSNPQLGTTTDVDGNFEISNVPLGRQALNGSYIGYENFTSEGFIVTAAKSVFIEIDMRETGVNLNEVVVKASGKVNLPVNELSVVSTRSFSADETDRIAASVNDPGRLATSYPGVTQGSDDAENDIIIRGNSSFGMMWRLEGIDIPNPNHFARPGTSGGGVTVFSAALLSRSDFSTGGMPAEYGNAISGVMDVHFRKGNRNERAHRFKVGVLGIDLATEGPIQKNKSSYLVNYRYSTLGVLGKVGVFLVGERITQDFQDLSFNIAFDENEKSKFTIFGLGGLSREHYNPIDDPAERDPTESNNYEDRIRDGNMGALGMTYTRFLDKQSYLKIGVAGMGSEIEFFYDVLDSLNTRSNYHDERHNETRLTTSVVYNRKINTSLNLKTGIFAHYIPKYNFYKKTIQRSNISDVLEDNTSLAIDGAGSTYTFQYFAQASKDLTPKLSVNAGAHFMLLGLNNTTSIEPRLSFKYEISPRQTVSLAYGIYSKILPMAGYFYTQRDTVGTVITESQPNFDLPMIKSGHFIASYTFATEGGLRFSAEAYYQTLSNVPISPDEDDLYWMLNTRSTFPETRVESDGTGENYGVDLAVEKFFSNQLYFLLTGSFFNSYFYPKNGERYNTTFANDFASALTIGREFDFRNGRILQIGARVLYSGGNRYTPLDVAASLSEGIYVPDATLTNTEKIPEYFRMDARVAYRYNTKKMSGSISLDVQNVLNENSPRGVSYNAINNELTYRKHGTGLIPVLAFQFDF